MTGPCRAAPVCIRVWWIPANQSKQDPFRMRFPCSVEKYTLPPPPLFHQFMLQIFHCMQLLEAKLQWRILPFSAFLLASKQSKLKHQNTLKRMYWKKPRLSLYRLIRIQTLSLVQVLRNFSLLSLIFASRQCLSRKIQRKIYPDQEESNPDLCGGGGDHSKKEPIG